MSSESMVARLALKTPEASLLQVFEQEFGYSPREAHEVLETVRERLGLDRASGTVQVGQVQVVVARVAAPIGPPLCETDKVAVTLTVDAGSEDGQVLLQQGRERLRQGRILRVLEEALEQGGVLTEEDLARVLLVSRRTIERDIQALKAEAHLVPTRGQVKGSGRGQTHKVRLIELWLDREGYDKIARWLHHSPQAIKRYVQTFLRIVTLYQQQRSVSEIAFLVGHSQALVQAYLGLYEQVQTQPQRREKLAEELQRVTGAAKAVEKGGQTA